MATEFARISGSYSTAYIGRYDVLSQNVAGNYTTFRLYGVFYYGGGKKVESSYSTFTLHTSTIKTGSYSFTPGEHQLGTVDINIGHNADGTFPSTYIGIGANSYHMNGSAGGYLSAPRIYRNATVTGATNFNDEQNPTITFSNPGGMRINARLEFAGTNIRRDNIANTGTYTFNLTEAERNLLRSKTPNSNTMTVREVIATCYSGTTESYWSWQDKTMTITNANPTFSNFTYQDINLTTVALTGSNQKVIKGYSNVEATIPTQNIATANKQATMSRYSFTCSDIQRDITYSSTEATSNSINNVKSGVFNVYAIDSRNNSTLVTKNATATIEYTPLIKNSINATRSNEVSEEVTLELDGKVDLVNFGAVTNSIQEAKYRYKQTDSDTWSNYNNITLTIDNNGNFSYNDIIEGDSQTLGFEIADSYNIEVLISDELSEIVYKYILGSGKPNIALHKQGVGIMGKYDTNVGGSLQIEGNKVYVGEVIYSQRTKAATDLLKIDTQYKYIEIYLECYDTYWSRMMIKADVEEYSSMFTIGGFYPTGGNTFYEIECIVKADGTLRFDYCGVWSALNGTVTSAVDNNHVVYKVIGYK